MNHLGFYKIDILWRKGICGIIVKLSTNKVPLPLSVFDSLWWALKQRKSRDTIKTMICFKVSSLKQFFKIFFNDLIDLLTLSKCVVLRTSKFWYIHIQASK